MKTFIITGIQMRNKGSQAMFIALRHSLMSIYDNCQVIGFANKYDDPEQYSYKLMPFDDYTRTVIKYRLDKIPFLTELATALICYFRKSDKWRGKIPQMRNALQNADAVFDASGYALGSGWPKQSGRVLLDTIRICRKLKKKIIFMPQSFGPFDWGEKDDAAFIEEMKKELSYPLRIYAREHEGYDCLTSLGLPNVELSADIVIREKTFPQAREIFSQKRDVAVEYPRENSVGLIINKNVLKFGDSSKALDLYARLLRKLLILGEDVHILCTSTADKDLVEKVLSRVENGRDVRVIAGEYSSPELIDIIAKFKYVVASRYHSVVFAYRSGVPAVILGWAKKYDDLAALFGQQDYVFDIRSSGSERILEAVEKMAANYEDESSRIKANLQDIQADSVVREAVHVLTGRRLDHADNAFGRRDNDIKIGAGVSPA